MSVEAERCELCRNCGTPVSSNFCPYCGQETALHPLSVWAFVHEFIGHYVAIEGKLWRTLALLALQPGRLTKEFLAGRRQRYVIPLRLYLTASFLFFALSQWAAQPLSVHVIHVTDRHAPSGRAAATEASPVPHPETAASAPDQATEDLLEARRELAQDVLGLSAGRWHGCAEAAGECPLWQRLLAPAIVNLQREPEHVSERFAERFRHSLSYAMFLLLPIFAGLLALVYRRQRKYYGEHLVFALHLHSFWFLLSLVFLLLPETAGLILPFWFAGYGFWAIHRVYGESLGATLLRGTAVMLLYGLVLGLGTAALSLALLAT